MYMSPSPPLPRSHAPCAPFGEAVRAYWAENPAQGVFSALCEQMAGMPAWQREACWSEKDLWTLFVVTGVTGKRIADTLRKFSMPAYVGATDAYDPSERYFWIPEAACAWQYFAERLIIRLRDPRLFRAFLRNKAEEIQDTSSCFCQHYCDIVFDFRTDEVRRNGILIKKLGGKSARLAKLLLENRNKRFTYGELATMLGEKLLQEDYRSSFSYARSLDKIFERLNRDIGIKIFHCRHDSVIVVEPCREYVGGV